MLCGQRWRKDLEARVAAENIKTEADLKDSRQVLMVGNMPTERVLNLDLDDHLGLDKHTHSD